MSKHSSLSQIIAITDTRESNPLCLDPLKTERKKLDTGDYSLKDFEDKVTIEVKELNDFIGCMTFSRERFERELDRMRSYLFRAIVVKSNWSAVELKQYRSQIHPNAVLGSAMAFAMNAQVSIIMADDHRRAGLLVARFLYVAWNRCRREKKLDPVKHPA